MDAFDRVSQLVENDPSITRDEIEQILLDEGYIDTKGNLKNFFSIIGVE